MEKPPRDESARSNSKMVSLRLPLDVLKAIDGAADESGVSRSEIISSALREWSEAYGYLEPKQQLLLELVRGKQKKA